MGSDLARKTAELAARDLYFREQPNGSNDSPRIREYLKTVGIAKPSTYCAAAVSTWIKEASQELGTDHTFKLSGGAQKLYFLTPSSASSPRT